MKPAGFFKFNAKDNLFGRTYLRRSANNISRFLEICQAFLFCPRSHNFNYIETQTGIHYPKRNPENTCPGFSKMPASGFASGF